MSKDNAAGVSRSESDNFTTQPPQQNDARTKKPTAKHRLIETALVQRIDRKRKIASASCGVNQYKKQAIYRVVFESELEITSLRQVASIFEVPERKILAALREEQRARLLSTPPPPGRGGIVVPLRKAA
jgi:hypothetical protein